MSDKESTDTRLARLEGAIRAANKLPDTVDGLRDRVHQLELKKANRKDFDGYKEAKRTEDAQREGRLAERIGLIERSQVEQKGGWKYISGAVAFVAVLLSIWWQAYKIGGK